MPRVYKTAQGKRLDMNALISRNERTRAVGNMKVNARGDTIDSEGKIVVPVTQKVGEKYQKTVGNKSANVVRKATAQQLPEVKEDLTNEELDLENELVDDLEVEAIKAKDNK